MWTDRLLGSLGRSLNPALLIGGWLIRAIPLTHSKTRFLRRIDANFSGLDALRRFSVLAVIWTHVTGVHAVHLLNQGGKGVDFFFAKGCHAADDQNPSTA
jgi:hypothetical protein